MNGGLNGKSNNQQISINIMTNNQLIKGEDQLSASGGSDVRS